MHRSASTKTHPVNGISTVSENHIFYSNTKENNVKPSWFINCTRRDAEEILQNHREYGNVLIRPNAKFQVDGSYALSACTIANGMSKYVHYIISRTASGFKLEVQSKPPPMASLKDVLDFYISAAGFQTHHAMVLDPTEASNLKTLCRNQTTTKKNGDYVNLPETVTGLRISAPTDDGTYLTMNGSSQKLLGIQRRCSAPVNKREYINIPKAAGAYPNSDEFYLNASQLESEEPKGRNCPDYINVANVIPGRNADRSPVAMKKASSFPVTGKDAFDESDDDDSYITPKALKPPMFSDDIRPPSIHQASGH